MSTQELLTELSTNGVILEAVGNELRINAPKGVITSELRQALTEHKTAILELLRGVSKELNPREIEFKPKMYENTKTWNPAVGCGYECIYCKPSFQRVVAWSTNQSGKNCDGCLKYYPHKHPERFSRIPSEDIIFAFGNGDISFYREEYVKQAIDALINNLQKSNKAKTVYFQSKNPECFVKYSDKLTPIKEKVVFLTTLETNRDKGYSDISKAPVPSARYKDFLDLDWHRKIVTIEPVMDFDIDEFVGWIREIAPESVYLGYNSRPDVVKLPEPSQKKIWQFYDVLCSFTKVDLKGERISQLFKSMVSVSAIKESNLKELNSRLDAPPCRLTTQAGHNEIVDEILRLEHQHRQKGLGYDRIKYLGDYDLRKRKEFLLDYLYSLCDSIDDSIQERLAIQSESTFFNVVERGDFNESHRFGETN